MSRLVPWLRRHRFPRIALIVGTFLLPPTNVVSAAIVVMTARHGHWRGGAIDVAAALAVMGGLLAYTSGAGAEASPIPAALGAASLWGGALLAGGVLGRFRSVDLALQVLVIAAMAGVLALAVAVPDARAYWEPILRSLIEAAGLPVAEGLPEGWLGTLAALMHGVVGASLLSTLVLALMLALWLDRGSEEGDGAAWRRQFLELRLGRVLSGATLLAVGLLAAGLPALGGGLLMVLGTAFATQGLAIVHWTADHRAWPRFWPLALYAPLLLGAPPAGLMLLLLALGGVADNFLPLRRQRANVV